MPDVAKLIQLMSLGGAFLERMLLKRFLLNVTALLMIAIVLSVVIAGVVAFGLYFIYWLMISHGVQIIPALLVTGCLAAVVIAILCILAISRFRRLHRAVNPAVNLPFHIEEFATEFVNGLFASTK